MKKTMGKLAIVGALSFGLISGVVGIEPVKVEASTKKVLPDNHTIQELKVEWSTTEPKGALIHVGDRKGTLLIRVDQPKKAWNIEWINWAISKPQAASFSLNSNPNQPTNTQSLISYFTSLSYTDYQNGLGFMKFSDFNNPHYYAGLAINLDKKFNSDGVYWFGGPVQEDGQVKAYFFEGVDLVEESMQRISSTGTFPLMNKVMWGKTELWKGQLGKVTIKKPTILWKRTDNGNLEKVRELKVGDEYRVYRYLDEKNGLYGVGAGMFVERNTTSVLYETPSKRNLRLVKIIHGEL